jgi:transposase
VTVERSILIAIWHTLSHNVDYQGLDADYFLRLVPERATRRAITRLNPFGYQVALNPLQAT